MVILEYHIIYIYNIYIKTGWWFGTFFPYIGNVIIPTDSYFSEGLKPPTSNYTGMIGNNSGTITADLISE